MVDDYVQQSKPEVPSFYIFAGLVPSTLTILIVTFVGDIWRHKSLPLLDFLF